MAYSLNSIQRASRAQFDRQAACYGSGHILRDVSDVAAALDGIETAQLSPALDVATGAGHTAAYLAGRGIAVTAADISEGMLAEEDGKIVWWWPRLTPLAQRPEVAKSASRT